MLDERQFRGKQGRLLFAYLATERSRPVSREELAAVLWPDNQSTSWEMALSALTSRLAGLLGTDALSKEGVALIRGLGQYQLRLPSDVWVDLESGISALDRAEAALRNGEARKALGPAAVAASLHRTPFLPGIHGFWQDAQRSKLERQLLRALDCLCEMQLAVGEPEIALETATEAAALDPYRERTQRNLMESYAVTGNPAQAVTVYHRFRRLLSDELGTETSPEIESLYLKLLD